MKRLANDFAWRADPRVPAFADTAPLFIYDGECIMCSGFVRWMMAQDRAGRIRVTPAQGPIGRGLYAHLGIAPDRFDTHLLVSGGVITGKSDAAIGLLRLLGGAWALLASVAALVPRPLRDAAYDWLARNRYRIRGRRDACWRPDPALAARVL
jgi:predicted DCC family thiol-disulfide oxidoreductase YuxK